MAQFPSIILTAAGQSLVSESQGSGKALIFTKVKLGDGALASEDNQQNFTDLKNSVMTANINSVDTTSKAGQCTIVAVTDNSAVETGFFSRELGVFAKVGDAGSEKLYAYTNADNYSDYMPDKNTPLDENRITIDLVVGAAVNVTAVIDSSQYATLKNLQAHDASEEAHGGLTFAARTTAPQTKENSLWLDISNATSTITGALKRYVNGAWENVKLAASQIGDFDDAVIAALGKKTLSSLGVVYSMASTGYISFGPLFGGLIIQWVTGISGDIIYPISYKDFSIAIGVSNNADYNYVQYNIASIYLNRVAIFASAKSTFTIFTIGK